MALTLAFGCFSLSSGPLGGFDQPVRVGVPLGIWVVLCWVAFRAVNVPRFADFLISVESELEKVVWPGRKQVMQSTIVVIATMLFLGLFLFGVDLVWRWFFSLIRFIEYE
ncbi:MAG: preprotein translocase subunit SecE [Fuerstiella sp.]